MRGSSDRRRNFQHVSQSVCQANKNLRYCIAEVAAVWLPLMSSHLNINHGIASKHEPLWMDEEPQTNAKNAYVCATLPTRFIHERMTPQRGHTIAMMRIKIRLPMVWCAAMTGLFFISVFGVAAPQDNRAMAKGEDSYFPLSIGNWWAYKLGGHSRWAGKTQKWTVTDKAIHKGNPDYILSPTPSFGWDSPVEESPVREGIVEAGRGGGFILKYPIRSGNRWSSKSDGFVVPGKLDDLEVVSAGKPCSVGSHSFGNCVTIRETDEGNALFSLTTYARGAGPVKYLYFKDLYFKQTKETMIIVSWKVL